MSSRRPPARRLSPNRSYSDDDDESPIADRRRSAPRRPSRGPRGPPDVPHTAQFTDRKRSARPRGYSLPGEKPRRGRLEITLRLCIFDQSSHGWRTSTLTFDAYKTNDREIWHDIRSIYRNELQGIWRRIFGFSKLKSILPIEVLYSYAHHSAVQANTNCSIPKTMFPFVSSQRTSQTPIPLCIASITLRASRQTMTGSIGSLTSIMLLRTS